MLIGGVTGFGLKLTPHVWAAKGKGEGVTAKKYIEMLQEHVFPELRANNPLHRNSLEGYIWMQVLLSDFDFSGDSDSIKYKPRSLKLWLCN